MDSHSGQTTAPLAGKSLAVANRPGAFERVGALEVDESPAAGTTVNLTWVGTPTPLATTATRADAPKLLEYKETRWELEAFGGGTRLMLWHNIDRRFISWGAAGWHISFDSTGRHRRLKVVNRGDEARVGLPVRQHRSARCAQEHSRVLRRGWSMVSRVSSLPAAREQVLARID